MFETEDFIQTSGVLFETKGPTAATVKWSDVKGGTDTEVDIIGQ